MNWFSYLVPITLYKGKTARKTLIEVREIFGQRKMDLNGYPQSGGWYRRIWKKVLAQKGVVKNVLLLGLGGGDVVKLLTNRHANEQIVVVEIESEIVKAAKEYFGIVPNEKLLVITKDAKDYMDGNRKKYDLVIVDLYNGDGIPRFVTTRKFLSKVERAMKSNGSAIFNYASHSFREDDFLDFEHKLNRVFSHSLQAKLWGHTFYVVNN